MLELLKFLDGNPSLVIGILTALGSAIQSNQNLADAALELLPISHLPAPTKALLYANHHLFGALLSALAADFEQTPADLTTLIQSLSQPTAPPTA